MSYSIKRVGDHWTVYYKGRVVESFGTQAEAQEYVQACIEDNNWHRANR